MRHYVELAIEDRAGGLVSGPGDLLPARPAVVPGILPDGGAVTAIGDDLLLGAVGGDRWRAGDDPAVVLKVPVGAVAAGAVGLDEVAVRIVA